MTSTWFCGAKQGTKALKIVADENIPYAREAFGSLGEVMTLPGREIDASSVCDAEILLVRSITDVNASLLEGSRVRFVGTATIGTEHVDEEYLRSRGIAFASAPGSNANSVAEYVVAALLTLARSKNFRLRGKTLGVIGVGNCGSRVVKKAEALGMNVLLNDPPLWRQTGNQKFLPIEELFSADILTLHVPLTHEGTDATHHLIDEALLSRLRPECVLINTSRGAVVDNGALASVLDFRKIGGAVLDVWEKEPHFSVRLLEKVNLGTPHIAGYSLDGKANATAMIYKAACELLGAELKWEVTSVLPKPHCPRIEIAGLPKRGRGYAPERHLGSGPAGDHSTSDEDIVAETVRQVYDIERDDAALRELCGVDPDERGSFFDALRKNYPVRREFHNTEVVLPEPAPHLAEVLCGLGFRVRVGREIGAPPAEGESPAQPG